MKVNKLTHQEQAYNKIQQLNQEIAELQNYIRNIDTEYEIITDQYMNGDILYDIGKQQRKLMKLKDNHIKNINKKAKEISRLKIKYGLG